VGIQQVKMRTFKILEKIMNEEGMTQNTGTGSGFKSLSSRSWGLGLGGEGAEVE